MICPLIFLRCALTRLYSAVPCSCASLRSAPSGYSTRTRRGRIRTPTTTAAPQITPPLYPSTGRSPGTKPPAGTRCTGTEARGRFDDPGLQSHSCLERSAQGWSKRRRGQTRGNRQSGERGRVARAPVTRRQWAGGGLRGWYPARTLGWWGSAGTLYAEVDMATCTWTWRNSNRCRRATQRRRRQAERLPQCVLATLAQTRRNSGRASTHTDTGHTHVVQEEEVVRAFGVRLQEMSRHTEVQICERWHQEQEQR